MTNHGDDDFDPAEPALPATGDLTASDATLLDRYLAGETSPEEDELVRSRFGEDLRPRVLAAVSATESSAPVDTAAAWKAVRERTARAQRDRIASRRQMPEWASMGFKIAASLLVIVGAGLLLRQVTSYAPRVAQTATGERRVVVLSDGTRVTLAPKSALTYPAAFAGAGRDVQLTGEAFFAVKHDESHPFTVHTNGATARDLGTEFGVRARTGDGVDVYVASGSVLLAPAHDSAGPVLTAGDLGHVGLSDGQGQVVVKHGAPIGDFIAWREGRIVATARPAAEVFDELGRWFDARFSVDPALASRSVTVDLRVGNGVTLESVLDALMLTLDASYVRDGQAITVRAR